MNAGTVIGLGAIGFGLWWYLSQGSTAPADTVTDLTSSGAATGASAVSTGTTSMTPISTVKTCSGGPCLPGTSHAEEYCVFRYTGNNAPINANAYPIGWHLVMVDDVDAALPPPGYYAACKWPLPAASSVHHHKKKKRPSIHISKVTRT